MCTTSLFLPSATETVRLGHPDLNILTRASSVNLAKLIAGNRHTRSFKAVERGTGICDVDGVAIDEVGAATARILFARGVIVAAGLSDLEI